MDEELRRAGLRVTGPRAAILHLLRHDTSHPTAEQVYARLHPGQPGLSLSTVYNTLETFSRSGLCRRMPPMGGSQRFDGTVEPHHHALCVQCGRIFDFPREIYQPLPPPPRLAGELEILSVQVTFEVTCTTCRRQHSRCREATDGRHAFPQSHSPQGGVSCPS